MNVKKKFSMFSYVRNERKIQHSGSKRSWSKIDIQKNYYYRSLTQDTAFSRNLKSYKRNLCFTKSWNELQLYCFEFTWSPLSTTIFKAPRALWRRRSSCSAAVWASISLSISTTTFKFLYPSSGFHMSSGATSTNISYLTTSSEAWTPAVSVKMITFIIVY